MIVILNILVCLVGCFSTTEKGGANYEREILMNRTQYQVYFNRNNESCKLLCVYSFHVSRLSSWFIQCHINVIDPHNEMGYMVYIIIIL